MRLPKPQHCAQPVYDVMNLCWQTIPNHRPLFDEIYEHLHNLNISKVVIYECISHSYNTCTLIIIFYLSVHLSSIYLCIYPSIYLSTYLSIYLSFYLIYNAIYLSMSIIVYLPNYIYFYSCRIIWTCETITKWNIHNLRTLKDNWSQFWLDLPVHSYL